MTNVPYIADQARLMLLAALSGEHILFIGPPGTAKSELGRRLSRLYNGPFFERLLTRFSVPEVGLAQATLSAIATVLTSASGYPSGQFKTEATGL